MDTIFSWLFRWVALLTFSLPTWAAKGPDPVDSGSRSWKIRPDNQKIPIYETIFILVGLLVFLVIIYKVDDYLDKKRLEKRQAEEPSKSTDDDKT